MPKTQWHEKIKCIQMTSKERKPLFLSRCSMHAREDRPNGDSNLANEIDHTDYFSLSALLAALDGILSYDRNLNKSSCEECFPGL